MAHGQRETEQIRLLAQDEQGQVTQPWVAPEPRLGATALLVGAGPVQDDQERRRDVRQREELLGAGRDDR